MPDSISTTDDNSDTVAFPAGSLPEELKTAALIPESEEFLAAQKSLEELRQMLG